MEKITNVKALEYAIENGANFPTEVIEKLTAIKTSYEKKSTNKKPTANQVANEEFKATIIDALADGEKVTVTELQTKDATLGALSNQRVSAILRQLVDAGKVVKTVDKKKSYFALAE